MISADPSEPLHGMCAAYSIGLYDSGRDNGADKIAVLDLPQIYTKPSGTELLRALDILAIKPRSFTTRAATEPEKGQTVLPAGVTRYLTSIISSPLSWLETDELREAVWDATGARLSERSGRTGTMHHPPLLVVDHGLTNCCL